LAIRSRLQRSLCCTTARTEQQVQAQEVERPKHFFGRATNVDSATLSLL